MPLPAIDPVVLAASIVVRLQGILAREVAPGDTAVVTVGSIQAGLKSNNIPDTAVLKLNVRTFDESVRAMVPRRHRTDRARRVRGECVASRCPRDPEFELYDRYPLTDNDDAATERVSRAFAEHFGDNAMTLPQQSAGEDLVGALGSGRPV